MADRSLKFVLSGQDTTASSTLGKVSESAEKLSNTIGKAAGFIGQKLGGELGSVLNAVQEGFDKVSESGSGVGTKLLAAGGAVTALGSEMQVMASGEEAAQSQLKAAIEATGNSWSDYSEQVEDAIDKGADYGKSGSDVQNALQRLTEATDDPTQALQKMGLVEDIAAAKHEGLSDAANQLALGLTGSAKVFKSFGVTLDTTLPKQQAVQKAMDELTAKLSGQADAAADTYTGRIAAIKAHLGDWASEVAEKVGPAVTAIGPILMAAGAATDILQARAAKAAAAQAALATATDAEAASATESVAGNEAAAASEAELAAASTEAAEAQGGSKLAALGMSGGILAIGAAATFGVSKLVDFINRNDSLDKVLANSQQTVEGFTDAIKEDGGAVGEAADKYTAATLQSDGLADKASKAGISLRQLTDGVMGSNQQFENLIDTWKKSGAPSNDTLVAISALHNQFNNASASAKKFADATADDTTQSESLTDILKSENDALTAYITSLDAASDPYLAAAKAQLDFKNGLADLTSQVTQAKQSGDKNAASLNDQTDAGRKNEAQVLTQIQAMRDQYDANIKNGMSVSQAIGIYQQQYAQLQATAKQVGINTTAVDQYVGSLNLLPSQVQTTVTANTDPALADVNRFLTYVNTASATVRVNAETGGREGPGHDASGGFLGEGETEVGEFGSETVYKRGSSVQVIPHGQSQGTSRRTVTQGGDNYNIYLTMPTVVSPSAQDGANVIAALEKAIGSGKVANISKGIR